MTPLHISSISEVTPSVPDLPNQLFDYRGNSLLARGVVFGIGISSFLTEPILKNNLVNNIPADDTSPPKKHFGCAVEFFQHHYTTASLTFHLNPPKNFNFKTISSNSHTKVPYFRKICVIYWVRRPGNGLDICGKARKPA